MRAAVVVIGVLLMGCGASVGETPTALGSGGSGAAGWTAAGEAGRVGMGSAGSGAAEGGAAGAESQDDAGSGGDAQSAGGSVAGGGSSSAGSGGAGRGGNAGSGGGAGGGWIGPMPDCPTEAVCMSDSNPKGACGAIAWTFTWCAPVSCPTTCGTDRYCELGSGKDGYCNSIFGVDNPCIESAAPLVPGYEVQVYVQRPNSAAVSYFCFIAPPKGAPCKEIVNAGQPSVWLCDES